ncbi:MAG: hypothetical protein K8I27_04390 [Planctomycetes bacterium]|nr:hypothetical protein [Planctomycetota bacterium]
MIHRFVILAHTVNGETHFDLMLEVAGQEKLRTYQLARWPLEVGESCDCTQLDDHRRMYLDYEGQISGGRGMVKRVMSGVWTGDIVLVPTNGHAVELSISGATVTRPE